MESNTTYTISTQIFKEGIINDTLYNVNIPAGQPVVGPIYLTARVNQSLVKGNAGTPSAFVKLTNLNTNEIKSTASSGTGSYQFGFLSNGTYRLTAEKTGYIFTPASKDLTLGIADTITADFLCTPNVGNILVSVSDTTGNPASGVTATAINYSAGTVFSGTTDNTGKFQFTGLSSGTYTLKLFKTSYSITPDSATAIVSNGITITKLFIIRKSTGSMSGRVMQYVNSVLYLSAGADIILRNLSTGQTLNTTSSSNGAYSFLNISQGDFLVRSSKTGFVTDSLQFHLNSGETKTLADLTMKSSFVKLTGKVVYNNSGLPGVIVTAVSASTLTDTTDSAGKFSFDNAEIKLLPTDTTIFSVKISGSGFADQSRIVIVPGTAAGSIISIPQFILPSGQISLFFSDLVNPVAGVKVSLTSPGNGIIESTTGNDGKFISDSKLSSGLYKLSISKKDYLVPDDSSLAIILDSDTTKFVRTEFLPYRASPITILSPIKQSNVKIYFTVKPVNKTAVLYYKQKSSIADFIQLPMIMNDSSFTGNIPPLYTLEDIAYFVSITGTSQSGTIYKSATYIITPVNEGMLNSIALNPDLTNSVLRKQDAINLSLTIRDGMNQSLAAQFTGSAPPGHVKWELSDPKAGGFSFPISGDSTSTRLVTNLEGVYKLFITASLNGVILNKSLDIRITNPMLKKIAVSCPVTSLSNKSPGVQFEYTASDTGGASYYLGNSIHWSITPPEAGSISSEGYYIPTDSTYIGTITVTAMDQVTSLSGNTGLSAFALITPASLITLTDRAGMKLTIKPSSVNSITKISLSPKPPFGPGKKIFSPLDQTGTWVVSDKQYLFVCDAGLGIDSLLQAAELELPLDNSLRFFEGSKSIANYDYDASRWYLKPSVSGVSNSIVTNEMFRIGDKGGEYAILSLNEPLGLKFVSILPSPFSPQVAPVKIGYFLSTNSPPANVTIKIYNVRGELIRTILNSSPQDAGVYGGRKGKAQIEWNGKTDDGLIANNGRYIIQITAKDITGEVTEVKQVVLVK